MIYSTYLGGSNADGGTALAIDRAGHAYVTGATFSTDFPAITQISGACVGSCGTGAHWDVIMAELNEQGTGVLRSTYLGGSAAQLGNAIALDAMGGVYLGGQTCAPDFPVSATAFQTTYHGGDCSYGGDGFVAKIATNGQSLSFATYLGGDGADEVRGIAVDSHGDNYMTGLTKSDDFPVFPVGRNKYNGNFDAFLTVLNPTGSASLSSIYLGGNDVDFGNGIAVDGPAIFVAGVDSSVNFPTTPGAFQTKLGSRNQQSAFVTKFLWR